MEHSPSAVKPKVRTSKFSKFWVTFRTAGTEFLAGAPMDQAATIAYYTIFSLPAVMIISIMVAASFYDEATVRDALLDQAGHLIGNGTSASLREMLENAQVTETRFTARVVGIAALAISAGTVFASLQNALNRIWQVEAVPGRAVWKYLSTRLLSLAMVACFGFLILVSLLLDTALVALSDRLRLVLSGLGATVLSVVNVVLSLGVITVVFAMVYRMLPDAKVRWKDVWGGALLTTVLFSLGKYLIGLYIRYSGVGDTYGAAGAVIIILVWVYYSTLILLYGAHFTHVVAREHDHGHEPSEHARSSPPGTSGRA
jgi:membrane protein